MKRPSKAPVRLLAAMVWGAALLNLWSALFSVGKGRVWLLRHHLPAGVMHGSRLLAVVAGFLLLFLGWGVWRHKRAAWQMTVALLAASAALHLLKGLDWKEAALSVGVLVPLLGLRRRFRARSDPASFRRALAVLAASVSFMCLYGTAGFYYLDREFHAHFSVGAAVAQTMRIAFTFSSGPVPHTRHAQWFLTSLYVVSIFGLVYAALAALRPVVYRSQVWQLERARASEIAARHGRSSLVPITLLSDKNFFFPEALDAYLAFRVVGRMAVVLGDPVCPAEQAASAIAAFASYCEEMDWNPCYYQVLPDYLAAYRALGYQQLKIGEEAIVSLPDFALKGGRWKDLRNIVSRLTREGLEVRFHLPPIDQTLIRDLREVSDDWLNHMGGREKRFSLGWFDPDYLRECDIGIVVSRGGRIEAFANFVTEQVNPVITPDLMRRRRDAPKGVMDFLFVRAAEHYRELGFQGLNLGLAPLAGVGEGSDARAAERAVRIMYERLNRFYSFQGLRAFKAKFHPRWEPRYLIYPSPTSLPAAALAVVRANNPGLL